MKKIRANVCAVTHAGRIRKENEDNYNLNGRLTSTGDLKKGSAFVQSMNEPFHLAVCDGMGGESYGEIASGIAVETIAAHASNVYESGEDFSFAISNCLDDANCRICAEINAKGKRMGTTLAAIYAVKGKVYCVNIGDTRVYHYSKGMLEQISFDHTHAQTIVDAGQVSQDNINRIPDAKRLTRHLGVFPEEGDLSPNISVIDDVEDGDVLLLCSDGLTDMLSDAEISAIISEAENSQTAASKLIRKALELGGKDNVTVMTAFLSVEETAIFAPIAAAVVGEGDADYEEEYRNSYGANAQAPLEENNVSPYANADARAPEKGKSKKMMWIIIAAAILGVILFVGLIFGIIKLVDVFGGDGEEISSTTSTTAYVELNTYPQYIPVTSAIETWPIESTESTTEDEEESSSTTRKPSSTTTTKKPTTTTTTEEPSSEEPSSEEPSSEEPSTEEPSSEEPSSEEPSSEEPSSEEPSSEESSSEESSSQENGSEE